MNARFQSACWLAVFLGWSLLAAPLHAEEDPAADGNSGGKAKQAERAPQRGKLPNFYAQVVDDAQREKIYDIQRSYKDQLQQIQSKIRELRKQVKTIKQQREEKVTAVLTAEQLAEVTRLREEAKKRRAARKTAREEKPRDS